MSAKELLAQGLKKLRYDSYDIVKVRGLFWDEAGGSEGFKEESEKLLKFFRDRFRYHDVDTYAIPLAHSFIEVVNYINHTVRSINREVGDDKRALLILHYGGHGDPDDRYDTGYHRDSVWVAGNSRVNWSLIQPILREEAKADVLLILDCCHAGTAFRARGHKYKEQILGAAGMQNVTFTPGPWSFTEALMSVCDELLKDDPCVVISKLHHRLAKKEAGLPTTPVVATDSRNSIVLHPLEEHTARVPESEALIHLELGWNLMSRDKLEIETDKICDWLRQNLPRSISNITVRDVFQGTEEALGLMSDISLAEENSWQPSRSHDEDIRENVFSAWKRVTDLVTTQITAQQGQNTESVAEHPQQAEAFLKELDNANRDFFEAVSCAFTQVSKDSSHELNESVGISAYGHVHALQPFFVKRRVQWLKPSKIPRPSGTTDAARRRKLIEYKAYPVDTGNPREFQEYLRKSTSYIEELAKTLSLDKAASFRTLPLHSWTHEPHEHRFVLQFEIPSRYESDEHCSLNDVIQKMKGPDAPTLQERLPLAYMLATALRNWHLAGWVHQGINSHDIFLFMKPGSSRFDYASPFLGGFDFARPQRAGSAGRPIPNGRDDTYRHPERLNYGVSRPGHRKRHDAYSLGVVLLEIGLWKDASEILKENDLLDPRTTYPELVQRGLIKTANDLLGPYAGPSYCDATVRCLQTDFVIDSDGTESEFDQDFKFRVVDKLAEEIHISPRLYR